MYEIEYTIYPDGRVEQLVKGIKGPKCLEVTKEINEKLGEVTETKPTPEYYEQEVEVSLNAEEHQTVGWSGSSGWGASGDSEDLPEW